MAETEGETKRLLGLRVRLMAIIGLALAPVFALAAVQTFIEAREQSQARRTELISTLRLFAHDQAMLIGGVRDLMEAVREVPVIVDNPAECDAFLSRLNATDNAYTNIAIVNSDGTTRCSGMPVPDGLNVANTDWFRAVMRGDVFSIGRARIGPVSNQGVLVLAIPVDDSPDPDGIIVTGVSISLLEQLGLQAREDTGHLAGIVDRSGRVLTQRQHLEVNNVDLEYLRQAAESGHIIFETESLTGATQTLALGQVIDDDVFVLIAQPAIPFFAWQNINITASIVLPILMWLLSLVVIWIASDFLVLRWLRYIRRFARLYGMGRYDLFPERASKAPAEIRELADSLKWMATRIRERDEELQESIDQKQMLIREVHHRVKNNLQIITSLINLQLGRLRDGESGRALREAQSRINALAMIHRNLYEAENLTRIEISPFIKELADLTHEASTGEIFRVDLAFHTELDDEQLTTDQAVPLSMFITEAMTNAYKHAFTDDTDGQVISVVLLKDKMEDGSPAICVTVADNGPGLDETNTYRGVGTSLFDAFAIQLDGKVERGNDKSGGAFASITFPVEPVEDD